MDIQMKRTTFVARFICIYGVFTLLLLDNSLLGLRTFR